MNGGHGLWHIRRRRDEIRHPRPKSDSHEKRLLLFGIPVALFAAQLPLAVWRFRTFYCRPADGLCHIIFPTDGLFFLVVALGSFVIAAAFGGLCLLLLWLHCLLNRRPLGHPAAAFLTPTLVVFTLFAAGFFWLELGAAVQDRAIVRMNQAWDAADPQTEADVRRLFGEPDEVDPLPTSSAHRWCYYPSRFPTLFPFHYQVWFDGEGNVTHHGGR